MLPSICSVPQSIYMHDAYIMMTRCFIRVTLVPLRVFDAYFNISMHLRVPDTLTAASS